ncbi:hypothetical protein ACFZDG_20560 [Kitasatospora xanthocidica]|uniref:hypothetical protein n=1 Tax=Kitasatospora xanthocidica TaxID=83382 RepID=UPI0036EEDB0E
MDWLAAAAVGGLGGIVIEAYDVIAALKWHGVAPWRVTPDTAHPVIRRPDLRPGEERLPAPGGVAYTVAVGLSTLVSATLAGVLAASYDSAAVPVVSFALGMAALGSLQKLAKSVPLYVATMVNQSLQAVVAARRLDQEPPLPAQAPPAAPSVEAAPAPDPTGTPDGPGEQEAEGTAP